MTLLDKFDKATDGWIVSHACEEIADDYAIEFAEWMIDIDNKPKGEFTIKELLSIFKKEKGYESIV
jgi:uncharacterized protein YegJ (DUF2314 family)